ncbi:fungal specific transcription factor [Ophiostoma piceae UAMH 11346]|uniref:Fungal specific transcription factor n=1 Tax=Ophiostoma piceae (strain UAMH 11346) TaxID=1262450 RepID=S3D8P2_OPHP1|nr:fungal specific transcription factor [Ophiostoma piceae UAMH 11346]
MVRMTIACARCRKLKVKCVHTGTAPCRNCFKKGPAETQTCVLSAPELKPKAQRPGLGNRPAAKRRQTLPASLTPSISHSPISAFPVDSQQQQRPVQSSHSPLYQPKHQLAQHVSPQHQQQQQHQQSLSRHQHTREGDDIFAGTDLAAVLSAFSVFNQKFPELRFIHLPTFTRHLRQAWYNESHAARQKLRLLCAAVIALCTAPHRHIRNGTTAMPSADRCAEFVRQNVSVFLSPDLVTVQTLVAFAMYEWGMGHGYRAWMLAGSATRMMQSLPALIKPSTLSAIEHEEQSRTFWSCFVLDRMVFCGQPQPFLLSKYDKEVRWPSSETDYNFGSGPVLSNQRDKAQPPHRFTKDGQREVDRDRLHGYDIDHYYGVLVQGFDIWARVLKFTVNGGRRMAGMSRPENHPWMEGSPWLLIYNELHAWRQRMDKRLRYPDTPVDGHAAMGHAEQFGYVNLVYYIALLFLAREYIPFLPTLAAEPTGPIDPPLLQVPAPAGWWASRSVDIFSSAEHIVRILSDMEDNGASLDTPFAGFCSFSAATMNLYVQHFPNMNLGRSNGPALEGVIHSNLRYLDAFQKVRPMGAGWWMTIQHCRTLFEQANQNKTLYASRTREDFEALENSVYDVRGQPPEESATALALSPHPPITLPPASNDTAHQQPTTLPPFGTPLAYGLQAVETPVDDTSHSLGQIWPLWGQQQTLPFALEGLPLDYNLEMIDMYQ